MPPTPAGLVEGVLDGLKRPALVLTDADLGLDADQVTVVRLGTPHPATPFRSVVLAAAELATLRAAVADLPALGRARTVGVVLTEATGLLPLRVRPHWPPLQELDARVEQGAAVTVARFATRLNVVEVLTAIAFAEGRSGHDGVLVGRNYDADGKVPPDVVIGAVATLEESPVLGRAPVVVEPPPAPLDETLFNPCGFRRDWERGMVDLDPSWRPTPALVAGLRDAQGVRVAPDAEERLVAALAMSGVPLVGHGDTVDLDDPDRREEHSIRQRRAALLEHSVLAWRARLAERAGVRVPAYPSVSVAPDLTGELALVMPADQPPGPDLVTDLLLARRYSGADLVGAGPGATEAYGAVVAGDPLLVDRSWCRVVGTDPARLLERIRAAGGIDYRTHGRSGPDVDRGPAAPREGAALGGDPGHAPHRPDAVVVRDRLALRSLMVPEEMPARVVAVLVERAAGAVSLVPRPEWPPLTRLRALPAEGGWLTELHFACPVDVRAALAELGRQAVYRGSGDSATEFLSATVADPPLPGRLDHRVLNPIGFDAKPTAPVVDAATLDLRDGVTEQLVGDLRPAAGLRVTTWDDGTARAVAGLAMAGVPVTAATAPAELLGAEVAAAVTAPVELDDVLAREEHSLVLRRAALDAFSRPTRSPAVSIVLATRRPDMLEFAVGQVARQRGVRALELVLAPHGFDVEETKVRDLLGPGIDLQVRPQPEATVFGDVLAAAAGAADGDVILKMDDDDWYAPDTIADLLRARSYSGAELVGMPAEFHYLVERDLTVRRGHPSELYASFVAGGTILVDRAMLREVGGFRSVRKYVDAQLLAAVRAAGGAIYRTHGLGYLLRRTPSGHTWQVDLDYLLDPARVAATYAGLRPSRLMEI